MFSSIISAADHYTSTHTVLAKPSIQGLSSQLQLKESGPGVAPFFSKPPADLNMVQHVSENPRWIPQNDLLHLRGSKVSDYYYWGLDSTTPGKLLEWLGRFIRDTAKLGGTTHVPPSIPVAGSASPGTPPGISVYLQLSS
uniref:Uncharacterized protein n=1 Tax=Sphaerodactylus townsendi TaxID=933632 RepID=A0ACB8EWF5_9SAUR